MWESEGLGGWIGDKSKISYNPDLTNPCLYKE